MTSAGARERAARAAKAPALNTARYPDGYYEPAPAGSHLHALFFVAASHNDDGSMRLVTEIDLHGASLAEMADRARAMALSSQPHWFTKKATQVEDAKCAHPLTG